MHLCVQLVTSISRCVGWRMYRLVHCGYLVVCRPCRRYAMSLSMSVNNCYVSIIIQTSL